MVMLRAWSLCTLCVLLSHAVDVEVQLPDPLFSGVDMRGAVVVSDASSRVLRIELPETPNVRWAIGRGSSSQLTIINGKRNQSETHPLIIHVTGDQPITLPLITVHFVDGSTIAASGRTVQPEQPNTTLSGEAYAEAIFDPSTIVPGQPTTLIYRLYLNQDRMREIREPSLTPPGELLTLGERTDASSKTIDGEGHTWRVQTWRWPVTASLAGDYTAAGQQEWFRCREDIFGRPVPESKAVVAIKPGRLSVTALPDQGRPTDFSGLIGPLTATASVAHDRIATGEGTVLSIALSGLQVGLARRPDLKLTTGAQAYPKDDTITNGVRTFSWDIVPTAPGSISVPAIGFPYFDPQTKTYRRTTTDPLTVDVLPGRKRDLVVSGAIESPTSTATEPVAIVLPPPVRGHVMATPPTSAWWMALLIGAGSGTGAALLWRFQTRPRRGPHRGRALRQALHSGDLDAIAAAIFALRPSLTKEQRLIADALERELDQARFGGDRPQDLHSKAAPLLEIA